ncbi:hypothetical protein OT109_13080 [Phycisphaeraceae bacterium D3-23]
MPDTAPNPPRFRWLKRLALCIAIALVGLALLRVYWGHREQSEFDRLVEAARDKGYPVYFEDLQPPQPSTQDNRATYIDAALQSIPYVSAQGQYIDNTDWYNEGGADTFDEHQLPDPVTDNAAYLAQFQLVLDAIRQAEALTRSDWTRGQPIPRPALNMLIPHLGECRRLARVIEDAIHRAMAEANYPLAVDMLGDLMTIADTLRDDPYGLINHLVLASIRAMAARAVQDVIPQLPDDPALAQQLEQLNTRWLDEAWAEQGLAHAYRAEMWSACDYVDGMIEGRYSYSQFFGYTPDHLLPLEFGPSRRLLRPYYQSDLSFMVRYYTALIDAVDGCTNQQDFDNRVAQSGVQAMAEALADAPYLWPIEYPISIEALWSPQSAVRTHFRHLATARLCATAIALKRYTIDHGQRPDTLADLVPDYLDAVPDDPFVLNRKVTYLPGGASPVIDRRGGGFQVQQQAPYREVGRRSGLTFPLLYCVGNDGTDDGGLFPIHDESGRIDGGFTGQDTPTDWCFFLTELPNPIPDPRVLPFNQRSRNVNPFAPSSLTGPPPSPGSGGIAPGQPGSAQQAPQTNTPDADPLSAGDEEQVDEQDPGGQDGEDEQRPDQPQQRDP